ncbi:MAG: hypothetical protein AAB909_04450 [Patescibacteria group bacterium]
MTKYKQAFEEMLAKHKDEFDQFGLVHDAYLKNQEANQERFNEIGKSVRRIVEDTERWLCGKMETAGKGKFSNNVADKFRAEVQARYKAFDMIGVTVS